MRVCLRVLLLIDDAGGVNASIGLKETMNGEKDMLGVGYW